MIEIKQRQVVIKPVSRAKFSGLSSYTNTKNSIEGAQLSKTGYKTGLSRQEEEVFCEELGLKKGTLAKNNSEFWGTVLNISLNNDKPTFFSVETLMDEIKLRALLNRDNIAANEVEIKTKPLADFYIDDVEAKAKVEEVVINSKMEALDALRNLSLEEKKGFLKLYGKRGLDTVNDSVINTSLFKEVDSNPNRFLDYCNNPDIKLRIDIEDMIDAGALVKKGNYYTFQNETIGNSVEAVIAFFKDLRNQSAKIAADTVVKQNKKGK